MIDQAGYVGRSRASQSIGRGGHDAYAHMRMGRGRGGGGGGDGGGEGVRRQIFCGGDGGIESCAWEPEGERAAAAETSR